MARKRVSIKSLDHRRQFFATANWSEGVGEVQYTELHGTQKSIRERIRNECPNTPGVYGMLSSEGHVVYVGMSNQLPKRLQSYFSSSTTRKKETRVRRHAVGVLWQPLAHPFLAKVRERQLIGRFQPPLNVVGHPVRMKTGYVVANLEDAPFLQLVAEIPKQHAGVWGPIPHNNFSKTCVNELNLHFGLRDCPKQTVMQFSDEPSMQNVQLPTCLRIELQTCLKPCLGGCSRVEYANALEDAQQFLSGKAKQVFADLDQEMRAAAASKRFEIAAKLRDRVAAFEYLDNHLRRFHDWSSRASFIYRIDSELSQHELWLVVVRGVIADLVKQPQTPEEKERLSTLIEKAKRQFDGNAAARHVSQPGEFETARALFHWFRKYPEEKKRQHSLRKALSICNKKLRSAS